ncbi:MAG TPA: nuclear transport factor 2 family protein [Dongiaceae bacterium]
MKPIMKRLYIALALWIVAVATPAFAQESTEAELNRLEDLRYEAMKNADAKLMGELFADDFVSQTLLGSTHSKTSSIAQFVAGDVKITSFRRENSRVKFYGDVATVMATTHLDIAFKGEPRQVSLFYLNVWVKRDGRWQLVARQSTALPKK